MGCISENIIASIIQLHEKVLCYVSETHFIENTLWLCSELLRDAVDAESFKTTLLHIIEIAKVRSLTNLKKRSYFFQYALKDNNFNTAGQIFATFDSKLMKELEPLIKVRNR